MHIPGTSGPLGLEIVFAQFPQFPASRLIRKNYLVWDSTEWILVAVLLLVTCDLSSSPTWSPYIWRDNEGLDMNETSPFLCREKPINRYSEKGCIRNTQCAVGTHSGFACGAGAGMSTGGDTWGRPWRVRVLRRWNRRHGSRKGIPMPGTAEQRFRGIKGNRLSWFSVSKVFLLAPAFTWFLFPQPGLSLFA